MTLGSISAHCALVVLISACAAESPDITHKIPIKSKRHERTEALVKDNLLAVNKAFGQLENVTQIVNNGLSRRDAAASGDGELQAPLFKRDMLGAEGSFAFTDAAEEHFVYAVNSDAALRLAGAGDDQVRFYLNGYVKEIEGEPRVINSELTVVYVHEGKEQTFRIIYQEGTENPNNRELYLKIDMSEIGRFYSALLRSDPERYASVEGSLTIRVTDEEVMVEGNDFGIVGGLYDVKFERMSVKVSRKGDDTRTIFVNGKIFKNSGEIGHVSIESTQNTGEADKLIVNIVFNDDGSGDPAPAPEPVPILGEPVPASEPPAQPE